MTDPSLIMAWAHMAIGVAAAISAVAAVIGAVQGIRMHPKVDRIEHQTNGQMRELSARVTTLEQR